VFPKDLPDGDLLIHAGDLSLTGYVDEVQRTLAWMRRFPHKYKVFIGGNHDNALVQYPHVFDEQLKPYKDRTPLTYLCGSRLLVEDKVVFGHSVLPYNPDYRAGARAYMLQGGTERHWENAPMCDILITHGPPKGIRDGENWGDPALRRYVDIVKPKLHVFGHIHCSYGMTELNETTFVNAALLDSGYKAAHNPVVVEV